LLIASAGPLLLIVTTVWLRADSGALFNVVLAYMIGLWVAFTAGFFYAERVRSTGKRPPVPMFRNPSSTN
jgi:hypothetical protein